MLVSSIHYAEQPINYSRIDQYVSRSAQPQIGNLLWLKKDGVTDIFNFRTMFDPSIAFDEKAAVEALGMKYHNIPSHTRTPKVENIERFLNEINSVIKNGGKAHIHCKAGADRTGMYSFIYKSLNGIGTLASNKNEMILRGHHLNLYPKLIPWIENFLKKALK